MTDKNLGNTDDNSNIYQEDQIDLGDIKKEVELDDCERNFLVNLDHIDVKDEPIDTADYVDNNMIEETLAFASNGIEVNDKVVVQESIVLKSGIKDEPYFSYCCSNCGDQIESYCTKCPAVVYILDNCALVRQKNIAKETIPRDLLGINFGVYALKVIPPNVRFGPFVALDTIPSTTGLIWRVKSGKLVLNKGQAAYANWMQYVNSSKNITERNLMVIQCDSGLYYETTCRINPGEELLVWFGKEYAYNVDHTVETYLCPDTGNKIERTYACTYCCLGFSSCAYLADHRNICLNKTNQSTCIQDIVCCPFCQVYLDEQEYMEFHLYYCCEKYARRYRLNVKLSKIKNKERHPERTKGGHAQYGDSNSETSTCEIVEDGVSAEDPKRFKCPRCDYQTNAIFYFRSHVAVHESSERFSCDTCGRWYARRYNLRVHVQTAHFGNDERIYKCSKCDFSARHRRYLECHGKTAHYEDKRYQCERCDFRTKYRRYLKHHLRLMHENVRPRKKRLFNNMKLKIGEDEKKERRKTTKMQQTRQYVCDKCSYKTCQKRNLRRHLYDHDDVKPFTCVPCGRGFKSNRDYTLHLKSKHDQGASVKEYKCDKCPYGTNRKGDLKKHHTTHEEVKQTFACELCERCFASKQNLALHRKNVHVGGGTERRCGHCTYKTRDPKELTVHLETHRLFVCKMCDKRFTARNNLRLHMRNKHVLGDEKDYKCAHCPFQTNYRRNLRYHLYTHGGERPFTCLICERGFTRKVEFDKHRHDEVSADGSC